MITDIRDRRKYSSVSLQYYFGRTSSLFKDKTMKSEYDFSKAEQGKFYDADAAFHYPIYLEFVNMRLIWR
jgi:hypothetical protein